MNELKYSNIIIDGSNLYHKSWANNKSMTTTIKGKKIITGGIFEFLNRIRNYKHTLLKKNGIIYLLFDNDTSKIEYRKTIDPEYKSNRPMQDPAFYNGINILQDVLLSFDNNIFLVYKQEYEADDLVLPLLNELSHDSVLLISDDLDWARCISQEVHWLNKDKIYDKNSFYDNFGFYPNRSSICLYKSIRGDKSDNIPKGIPNIRENILVKIVNQFSSIKDFFNNYQNLEYLNDLWKNKIKENKARILLNYRLADFMPFEIDDFDKFIFECSFKRKSLSSLYNLLGFNSSFDERLQYKDKNIDENSFFNYESIPRV